MIGTLAPFYPDWYEAFWPNLAHSVRIGPATPGEQVDIWRRAWILFFFALSWTSSSLDPRIGRASTACYLLYITSYSKTTKTTQGYVVCCSWRTTQHVPFCSKAAPWRRFVGLRRFKTIFDCCRVFEGAKTIPNLYGVSFWFPSLWSIGRFYSKLEHRTPVHYTHQMGRCIAFWQRNSITLPSLSQLCIQYSGAAGFKLSAIHSLIVL